MNVELAKGYQGGAGLAHSVEAAIKSALGATARVVVLAPNSLDITEGKTKRVVRDYT